MEAPFLVNKKMPAVPAADKNRYKKRSTPHLLFFIAKLKKNKNDFFS